MFNLILTAILRANVSNFVKGLKQASGELTGFQKLTVGLMQGLTNVFGAAFIVSAIKKLVSGFTDLLGGIISISAELQSQRISMGTLLSTSTIITNETGKQLEGQEKLNAAYLKSNALVKQARLLAALNVGTTSELLEAWTSILGLVSDVSKKGEDAAQKAMVMANLIMTAAKVLGPSVLRGGMGQAIRESNEILSGRITILNKFATAIHLTKEEFKQLRKEGVNTYDILYKKLVPFQFAQMMLSKSFEGVMSSLKDFGEFFGAIIGEFGFDRINAALNELVNSMLTRIKGIPQDFSKVFYTIADKLAPIFDELIVPIIQFVRELLSLIIDNKDLIVDLIRLTVQGLGLTLNILSLLIRSTNNLLQAIGPLGRLALNLLSGITGSLNALLISLMQDMAKAVNEIKPLLENIGHWIDQYISQPIQKFLNFLGISTDLEQKHADAAKAAAEASKIKTSALGGLNDELKKNSDKVKDNTQHWKNWIATMRGAFNNRVPQLAKSFLNSFGATNTLSPGSGQVGSVPVTFNFNTSDGQIAIPGRMTPQDIAQARANSKALSAGITQSTRRNSYAPSTPQVVY